MFLCRTSFLDVLEANVFVGECDLVERLRGSQSLGEEFSRLLGSMQQYLHVKKIECYLSQIF